MIQLVCVVILGLLYVMFYIIVGLAYMAFWTGIAIYMIVNRILNRQPRQVTPPRKRRPKPTMTSKEAADYAWRHRNVKVVHPGRGKDGRFVSKKNVAADQS
jgi:hypothetical protein